MNTEWQLRNRSYQLLMGQILLCKKFNVWFEGLHHLTYQEPMERKSSGICFGCRERFRPSHQCSEKQLKLVILGGSTEVNEERVIVVMDRADSYVQEMMESANNIGNNVSVVVIFRT
jgi:hypothetical protein